MQNVSQRVSFDVVPKRSTCDGLEGSESTKMTVVLSVGVGDSRLSKASQQADALGWAQWNVAPVRQCLHALVQYDQQREQSIQR
jgi:hypothetical protein